MSWTRWVAEARGEGDTGPIRRRSTGDGDILLVTSDSGVLTVLVYDGGRGGWLCWASHGYGRSGIRREIPGQFLTVEPLGRGLLVSACEQHKLAYLVHRPRSLGGTTNAVADGTAGDGDGAGEAGGGSEDGPRWPRRRFLLLSSPLVIETPSVVVQSVAGVDVGAGSPVFACLEMLCRAYDDGRRIAWGLLGRDWPGSGATTGAKALALYRVDLATNRLVLERRVAVPDASHRVVRVPGTSCIDRADAAQFYTTPGRSRWGPGLHGSRDPVGCRERPPAPRLPVAAADPWRSSRRDQASQRATGCSRPASDHRRDGPAGCAKRLGTSRRTSGAAGSTHRTCWHKPTQATCMLSCLVWGPAPGHVQARVAGARVVLGERPPTLLNWLWLRRTARISTS